MNIEVGLQGDRGSDQETQQLGPLGQGRPDRHAEYRDAAARSSRRQSWSREGRCSRSASRSTANGPQTGLFGGRFNPIHQMLATGTDAIAGQQDWNKIRYADDTLNLCVQGATHWDALGHIFYETHAYNGHDAKLIDSRGLSVLGIEHSKRQDERPRRAARHCPPPRRRVAEGRRGASPTTSSTPAPRRRGVEIRQGRFRHHPHRPDGALPEGRRVGRLCRRRRAGREIRELLLVPREGDRGDLHRHLGRGGAAERDDGGEPALALGRDPGHGPLHGRDFLSEGARRRIAPPTASTSSSSAARR